MYRGYASSRGSKWWRHQAVLVIRAIWDIETAIRSNYGEKLYIGEAQGSGTAQARLSAGAMDSLWTEDYLHPLIISNWSICVNCADIKMLKPQPTLQRLSSQLENLTRCCCCNVSPVFGQSRGDRDERGTCDQVMGSTAPRRKAGPRASPIDWVKKWGQRYQEATPG